MPLVLLLLNPARLDMTVLRSLAVVDSCLKSAPLMHKRPAGMRFMMDLGGRWLPELR